MLKKSKKSGAEASYEDLEKASGGKVVSIEEHPEVVNDIPKKSVSKWAKGGWKYAILDDKTNKVLDFDDDVEEATTKDELNRALKELGGSGLFWR